MQHIIAIVFALIAGALGVQQVTPKIQSWWVKHKNSSTIETARHIYTELKPHYAARGGFGNAAISATTINDYSAAPKKYVVTASGGSVSIVNEFGGTWTFTGAGQKLYADVDNVPNVNCRSMLVDTAADDGLTGIAVAASVAGLSAATIRTPAVDDATAKADCSSASDANSMRFIVGP